jgi:hypothetical protein
MNDLISLQAINAASDRHKKENAPCLSPTSGMRPYPAAVIKKMKKTDLEILTMILFIFTCIAMA